MSRPYRTLIAFLPRLWSNWITLLGAIVTSIAGAAILTALAIDLASTGLNTYAATLLFLVMPAAFATGLALIPAGLYWERRRRRREGARQLERDSVLRFFTSAMESPIVRRRAAFVILMTLLNVFIIAAVTHRAVTFMDTPRFCGNVCHTVMQPEYEAHQRSPHSRVACVSCHVGQGASGLAKAKTSGLRRVWGVMTGSYARPIETPVHDLPAARETCASCHQPARPAGTRLGFRVRYKDDAANSAQVTALMFNMGGDDPVTGAASGIHFHASRRYQVRFEILDDRRQTIGRVQKLDGGKVVAEYLPPKGQTGKVLGTRTMDCTDCHNRPTHIYDGTPQAAVDKALTAGILDRGTPWLHQMAVAALTGAAPAREGADIWFRKALDEGYGRAHAAEKPAADKLDAAARGLATLYRRNVYPEMKLSWNRYPSNIGHNGPDPGDTKAQCFRCHAGDRQTADGRELSGKCESCHEVVAKDELPADLPDEIRPLLHL